MSSASLKGSLLIVLIVASMMIEAQSGIVACVTCLGALGSLGGATGTAVGSCFTLGIPHLVCTCIAGLGITVSTWGVIMCIPPCLAPTP